MGGVDAVDKEAEVGAADAGRALGAFLQCDQKEPVAAVGPDPASWPAPTIALAFAQSPFCQSGMASKSRPAMPDRIDVEFNARLALESEAKQLKDDYRKYYASTVSFSSSAIPELTSPASTRATASLVSRRTSSGCPSAAF